MAKLFDLLIILLFILFSRVPDAEALAPFDDQPTPPPPWTPFAFFDMESYSKSKKKHDLLFAAGMGKRAADDVHKQLFRTPCLVSTHREGSIFGPSGAWDTLAGEDTKKLGFAPDVGLLYNDIFLALTHPSPSIIRYTQLQLDNMAFHYCFAHHRPYSLNSSSSEYFVMSSGEFSSSPPTSGDHAGGPLPITECMERWHTFLSCLTPDERRILSETNITMWREVQIFTAVEGAFAGQSHDDIAAIPISDETFATMLADRPRPALWPQHGIDLASNILMVEEFEGKSESSESGDSDGDRVSQPTHFENLADVPADYTGPLCVRGRWYHES